MIFIKWPSWFTLLALFGPQFINTDEKYNIQNKDGSFQFGYDTPDSYHYADANRNNVVRGEFGGRNPGTGAIDKTIYTAGPRGYRPRGKNIVRKYDLNQNGPRPIGSSDDPYFDPYEDPSYNFNFRTRTYSREENANRVGDVRGSYSYLDDVGERHNVEFIAGKNTGFHVKTPFPDSNPRAYGGLFFNGRGKPIPRGRTSIQRGLDGSYKFVSAGPDQRRTETSDSSGHVRGSYTYLDDKGVQHSVHYIAGPETGYRVLKNVKGPHIPTVYPFSRPSILSPDFYEPFDSPTFDKQGGGITKPTGTNLGTDTDDTGFGTTGDSDFSQPGVRPGGLYGGPNRPSYGTGTSSRPFGSSTTSKPFSYRPTFDDVDDDTDLDPFASEFGRPSGGNKKPSSQGGTDSSTIKPDGFDDGAYKPTGEDGTYKPGGVTSGGGVINRRPGGLGSTTGGASDGISTASGGGINGRPGTDNRPGSTGSDYGDFTSPDDSDFGLFGSETSRPIGGSKKPGVTFGDKVPTRKPETNVPQQDDNSIFGSDNKRPSSGGSKDSQDLFGGGGTSSGYPGTGQGTGGGGDDFSGKPTQGKRPSTDDRFGTSGTAVGGDFGATGTATGGDNLGGNRRPVGFGTTGSNQDEFNFRPVVGNEGDGGTSTLGITGTASSTDFFNERGTIITNLGDRLLSLPPGVSIKARVQAIDLLPLGSRTPSPSDQFKAETALPRDQLNEESENYSTTTELTVESQTQAET